jgi:hypothetical protein
MTFRDRNSQSTQVVKSIMKIIIWLDNNKSRFDCHFGKRMDKRHLFIKGTRQIAHNVPFKKYCTNFDAQRRIRRIK